MKRIILIYFTIFFATDVHSQNAPSWSWANCGVNSAGNQNVRVAIDKQNNSYTSGIFRGTITFNTNIYTCQGLQNIYITKHDNDGNLIWSQAILGAGNYIVYAQATDQYGNLYLSYSHASDSANATALWEDICIVKIKNNGQIAWTKWYGTKYNDAVTGIAVDSKNNIILSGYFFKNGSSPPLIDSIKLDGLTLVSKGNTDIFLAKMDSSGVIYWAKDIGTKYSESANSISLTSNDEIIMVGSFENKFSIDSLPQIVSISTGPITGDYFVAKFDSLGRGEWIIPIGGRRQLAGTSGGEINCNIVCSDANGSIIIGGNFNDCDLKIGNLYLTPTAYNLGTYDMWFAKLDDLGIVDWAKKAGGINFDFLRNITTDSKGNIYLTGEYGNNCVFENDTLHTNGNFTSYFVSKYDPNGNLIWYKSPSTNSGSVGYGVAINNIGELLLAGSFQDPVIHFGTSTLINGSLGNGFLAKLNLEGVFIRGSKVSPLVISPCPATKFINVSGDNLINYTNYMLFNSSMQLVLRGSLRGQSVFTINLPDLCNGQYYLELIGINKEIVQNITVYN